MNCVLFRFRADETKTHKIECVVAYFECRSFDSTNWTDLVILTSEVGLANGAMMTIGYDRSLASSPFLS